MNSKVVKIVEVSCCFLVGLFLVFSLALSLNNYFKKDNDIKKIDYTKKAVFPEKIGDIMVYTQIIDKSKARSTTKRLIKYVVIHETDNVNAGVGAKNHANYLSYNNVSSTSWHYTVDDKEIYHHIPDNEIAHHAGEKLGNMYGIGIELCVNKDGDFDKTFENAARLVAYLLKEYDLDIDAIRTHNDFTGKDCPHLILKYNRLDEFKDLVKKLLEE